MARDDSLRSQNLRSPTRRVLMADPMKPEPADPMVEPFVRSRVNVRRRSERGMERCVEHGDLRDVQDTSDGVDGVEFVAIMARREFGFSGDFGTDFRSNDR